jgi:hypothetical protein
MPAFVPAYVQPTLIIGGQTQTLQYGITQAISQTQLTNLFPATSLSPSQNCFEFINSNNDGFRLRHKTLSTDTIGTLTLETFVAGALPGTTLMTINPTGTIGLPDNVFTLQNSADATKQLQFSLSGIATGTTRTLTAPNANGTLALLSNTLDQFGAPAASVAWNSQNLTGVNNVQTKSITGNSTTPTFVAGTGAGTSPTITVTGTQVSGVINVTTGTTPSASAIVVTITVPVAVSGTSNGVIIEPANALTANLPVANNVFSKMASTTTFTITATGALTAASAYSWNYILIG